MATTEHVVDLDTGKPETLKYAKEKNVNSGGPDSEDAVELEAFIEPQKGEDMDPPENVDATEHTCAARALENLESVSCTGPVVAARRKMDDLIQSRKVFICRAWKLLLLLGYLAYFIYAMVYRFGDEGSIRLLVVTVAVLIGYTIHVIKKKFGGKIKSACGNMSKRLPRKRTRTIMKKLLTLFVALYIFVYVLIAVFIRRPASIIPAVGLLLFILLLFFFSHDPSQVTWRPVLWGLLLQLIFALIVLRTTWGYDAFFWLGQRVTEFLAHADVGARFVFGGNFMDHFFAFQVMSVIFFFSSMISILYYLGWMQAMIEKMALLMQYTLGTSPMESLHAAVNVFVGWGETTTMVKPLFEVMTLSELHTIMTNGFATVAGSTLAIYTLYGVMSVIFFFSSMISILYYLGWMQAMIEKMALLMQYTLGTSPMESLHAAVNVFVGWGETTTMVKPLFEVMTLSELHTIMTNGFATVAGSTLAIYTLYGAPANHLISASVMSAPAALAISKLFWPEERGNRHRVSSPIVIKREGYNIIDAASVGAITALPIIAYIIASVISFFSLLGFLNATLAWLGERIGLIEPEYPTLTFQLICSYLFWPLVFLMGVRVEDCRIVARMVGIKTFVNEFLAYEDLGKVIKNGEKLQGYNGTWYKDSVENIILQSTNETLVGGIISKSSEVIATYALCGFANVTALGVMIGALTAISPTRKEDIVKVSFRALISGCMACFVTACVVGVLGQV